MKTWSGFIALFGIAMVINAAEGKWAFDRKPAGAVLITLDAVIAFGCFVLSYRLWRKATHEELIREVRAIEEEQATRPYGDAKMAEAERRSAQRKRKWEPFPAHDRHDDRSA